MNRETPVFVSCLEEVTPNMLKTVYFEVNESFANYFGMGVKPPFVSRVTWSDQVNKNTIGIYQSAHIILYPRRQKTDEPIPEMRTIFAHEMGHGFYMQLLADYSLPHRHSVLTRRGYGIAVEEAFANFVSIIDQEEGNPLKVTKLLKPHITETSLLFNPERIARYPKKSDYFKDPAFLHYIYQLGGLKKLMKFLIAVPSTNYEANSTLASIKEKIIGKRRGREYFRRYYSLLNKLFGIDSDSLSKSANSWYSCAV